MDFLDPKKRRANRIQLFIGYGLMAIVLCVSTYILVNIIVHGYGVDRKTRTIIQNGLVFVDAHPESATTYMNGENKGTTSKRLTIPGGQYNMELQRPGYKTWKHSFTLSPEGVERFVYPFLFPEKLVTKDVDLFTAAPGMTTLSPDHHWLIAQQGTSLTAFDQVDLNNGANPTANLTFPSELFTAATGNHQLEAIEWASDNRHVLVKHTYNNATSTEYVMLDRDQPTSSLNLTTTFPTLVINSVSLRNKHFDQLYVLTSSDGTLTLLDTKSRQTTVVASRVLDFKPFGDDKLLYVTSENATTSTVLVRLKDGSVTYTLRSLPANSQYLLDMASFSGGDYVLAGAVSESKVYEYKDPIDSLKSNGKKVPSPIALLKVDNPQFVSFSQNTRFAAVQGGGKFAIYDAETERQYRFDTKLTLDTPGKASWMDGHRFVMNSDGKAVVVEFDGANQQVLSSASAGYSVYFDSDYTALFTIAPSVSVKDHLALTRTELKVKQ